jgi:hypothetical protein
LEIKFYKPTKELSIESSYFKEQSRWELKNERKRGKRLLVISEL